ncbi:MAG: transcription termination factor NusA [Clostridia bacterium]
MSKSEKINPKALLSAMEELYTEKGITKEYMVESLKMALEVAYKKNFGSETENIVIKIDDEKGEAKVFAQKEVVATVEEVENNGTHITLQDAKNISKRAAVGDILNVEVTPKNFGRIAAVTGKQVIVQRLREAERDLVFSQYSNKAGEIVVGIVQRMDKGNLIIDLGRVEAFMPAKEQVKTERFETHDRIKAFVVEVNQNPKFGPQVLLSRTHPNLVKKLFEMEVPEIADGIIEIKNIVREAGARTKVAVWSNDENIDPIGSCIGKRGMRIQKVTDELQGEKIDIIPFSDDAPSYIINALSPAQILAIDLNEEENSCLVVVPDDQLSLAIGAGGQNVRLAANLTGWKIDIKSESQVAEQIVE